MAALLSAQVSAENYSSVRSPAAPMKPNFEYKNTSGQFKLHEGFGEAIYKWFDGNFYSDQLEYNGRARVGQPDDDYNNVGFDSGWVYKVKNEEFYFLFSEIAFTIPELPGITLHRMYTSEDGKAFNRWMNLNGTTRTPLAPVPQPLPPNTNPNTNPGAVTPQALDRVAKELDNLLSPLAVGNEGKVTVSASLNGLTTIHCAITVKHKHVVAGNTIYSANMSATLDIDILNPTAGVIDLCVGLPQQVGGGNACIPVPIGAIVALL